MSSPLDGRIRVIAEQVLAAAAESGGEVSLQQQITDLHEHLHEAMKKIGELTYRLEFLEQGAKMLEQAAPGDTPEPAKTQRVARKRTGE